MVDLIDRAELMKVCRGVKMTDVFPDWKLMVPPTREALGVLGATFKQLIMSAPTVTGLEVKREPGVWEDDYCDIKCSVCNSRFSDEIVFMTRDCESMLPLFCPRCGARMVNGSCR